MCGKKIKYVNLTAHTIRLLTENGFEEIPTSGSICRVNYDIQKTKGGVKFNYNNVVGLPPMREGVYYIVSATAVIGVKELHTEWGDVVAHFRVKEVNDGVRYCEGFRHNG